jgi:hypothetical protein
VAQLYPQALGTHFSRLLRHAWVTVGLSFNRGHHMGSKFGKNRENRWLTQSYSEAMTGPVS